MSFKVLNIRLGEGKAGSMKSALYVSRCLKEIGADVKTMLSPGSEGEKLCKMWNLEYTNNAELKDFEFVISHTGEDRDFVVGEKLKGLKAKAISFRRNEARTFPVIGAISQILAFWRFVAVSDGVRRSLVRRGYPPWRINVIRNAIDPSEFCLGRDENLAKALGLQGRPTVGMVSAFHKRKGFDVLFEALSEVPDINVLIVGIKDEYKKKLERNLKGKLIVKNFVPFYDIPRYYSVMDVFVLPSKREGLPLALLEAMASGIPVVASRISGICEVVEDGINGLLFKNAKEMRACVLKLLEDERLRRQLSGEAKVTVEKSFSLENLKRGLAELFGI